MDWFNELSPAQLLGLGPRSVSELQMQAEQLGYRFCHIDAAPLKSKVALLQAIASAFGFPSYFGDNWDALYDCLTDLEAPHCVGQTTVLVLTQLPESLADEPELRETLLAILSDAVDVLAEKASPMWVFWS